MKSLGGLICSLILVTFAVIPFLAGPGHADMEIQEIPKLLDKFTIGGNVHVFYRMDQNPYYGADITPEEGASTNWGETYSTIRMTGEKNIGWTTIQGQFAPYYAETIGQDAYGLPVTQDPKDRTDIGINQAWLKFRDLFGTPLDLTIGRQDIKLEKGFVIFKGEAQEAALWAFFHSSWPFAVRLDGDFGKFNGTLFWAESGKYTKYADLNGPEWGIEAAGLNLHYDISDTMYVYGGVYQKDEKSANSGGAGPENDTLAYDIGVDAKLGGLHLEGEYMYQTGDVDELDRESMGYFASATYRFDVAMAPFIRGTYINFSGDDDPNDGDVEIFDPMFSGFPDWNRWVIGELVGEMQLPRFNKEAMIAEIGFSPVEKMTATLMYIKHELLEENFVGNPVSSTDWADEFNLIVDYPLSKYLFSHIGLGYTMPGDAAEEVYGDNEDSFFAQVWLNFHF
jgi:hypothetical protein